MIQRIQTVYLALAAIACFLLFFFPLASYYDALEGNYKLFIHGIKYMDPEPKIIFSSWFTTPMIALVSISIAMDVITILLYRKRPLQLRLISLNVLLLIILVLIIFFFYASRIQTMTRIEPEYNLVGMMLPLVALVFLILSNRAIRKDETLVRSTDRLR